MQRERKYDVKLTGTRKYNESRSRKEDRKDRKEKSVRYIGIGKIKIEKTQYIENRKDSRKMFKRIKIRKQRKSSRD